MSTYTDNEVYREIIDLLDQLYAFYNHPAEPFNWSLIPWSLISKISQAGKARDFFKIGDEKNITLSTGEEITMVVLGFDHDKLTAGGKAGITFGMKNCLETTYQMNTSATNAGGWKSSLMRTSTMETLYGLLPTEVKAAIKPVDKQTSVGSMDSEIDITSDRLFLFSQEEVMGTICYGASVLGITKQNSFPGEGVQYEYFKGAPIPQPTTGEEFQVLEDTGCFYTADTSITTGYTNKFGRNITTVANWYYNYNNGKAEGNTDTTATNWVLRSPCYDDEKGFCFIGGTGGSYSGGGGANSVLGVSFGFCV